MTVGRERLEMMADRLEREAGVLRRRANISEAAISREMGQPYIAGERA